MGDADADFRFLITGDRELPPEGAWRLAGGDNHRKE